MKYLEIKHYYIFKSMPFLRPKFTIMLSYLESIPLVEGNYQLSHSPWYQQVHPQMLSSSLLPLELVAIVVALL